MSLTKASYAMINGAVVNVLDYGAVGDGTTDDTAAFQAALATGKAVYAPKNTYVLSGALQMQAGQTMFGDGHQLTLFTCKTTIFTGVFVNMTANCRLAKLQLASNQPLPASTAGTGVRAWNPAGEYNFTGYIDLDDVNIVGFNYGIDINNIYFFRYCVGQLQKNSYGINIAPSYSASQDSGYVTTLTFEKLDIFENTIGVKGESTIVSKNVVFRDCAIESNTSLNYQAYLRNIILLSFENCYLESGASVGILLHTCETNMVQMYCNGGGGISLAANANKFYGRYVYASTATDTFTASGGANQRIHLENSSFASGSTFAADNVQFQNVDANGSNYKNNFGGYPLALSRGVVTGNGSNVSDVIVYKKTVTKTISANSDDTLIADQYVANLWLADYTAAFASIANLYKPGLILTVTPATTGDQNYFCVVATNTTGSSITLTSAQVKVVFLAGTAIAI
jgi:hypothetical protein